jgi:hypothetical protein
MFDVEKSTEDGRIGKLEIGGRKVETPANLPTNKELTYLKKSPFVGQDDMDQFQMGVLVEWFDGDRVKRVRNETGVYSSMKGYLASKIKEMDTPVSALHFEFGSDVDNISDDELNGLLKLQNDLEMDLLEIPNPALGVGYSQALEAAAKWKKENGVDKPLMAVIANMETIDTILGNIDKVDSCGLSFRSPQIPLLERVKEKITPQNIWIHAFSVPRAYRQVDWEGTLGILNNYYGIDSFSHYVGHPSFAQRYFLMMEDMGEDEKAERAQSGRFFVLDNYGTPRLAAMEKEYGPDHELSEFCKCSVCQKNTLENLLADYDFTFYNSRAHGNLANTAESANFRKSVENDEERNYIDSKEYAKKIIR